MKEKESVLNKENLLNEENLLKNKNLLKDKNLFKSEDVLNNREKALKDDAFYMKINSDLKRQFNIKCIENETKMNTVITELIQSYVEEK